MSSALDPHCLACGAEKVRASSASGDRSVTGWQAVCVSQHEDGGPFYLVGQITWSDSRGLGLRVGNPTEVIVFEWEMVMCLGQSLSVMQTPEEVFNP